MIDNIIKVLNNFIENPNKYRIRVTKDSFGCYTIRFKYNDYIHRLLITPKIIGFDRDYHLDYYEIDMPEDKKYKILDLASTLERVDQNYSWNMLEEIANGGK